MKRAFFVIVLVALFFTAVSAQGNPFTSRPFKMVYEGSDLPKPINVEKLEKSALTVLVHYNWVVQSNEGGVITAKFEKGHGKINAVIEVTVSEDGYSIKYVSSKGLDVNLDQMKIHANYVKWVRNLIKDIGLGYLK